MSITVNPQFVTVPLPGGTTSQEPTALYQLQEAAQMYVQDPEQFTASSNTGEYASPSAFIDNLISYAKGLCYHSWSSYTCQGFDPVAQGQYYAQQVFAALQSIILPSTGRSVYDTWISRPPDTSGNAQPVLQAPFNPAVVSPVQVPQSVQTITPLAVVPIPQTTSGVSPTGITPTIQETQQRITSAQLSLSSPTTGVSTQVTAVPGIPQSGLLDYVTQWAVSKGIISDNQSQSQVAAQGGQASQVSSTPDSANVSVSLPTLPFGLTWPIVGIGVAALVLMSMSGNGSSGRRGRY